MSLDTAAILRRVGGKISLLVKITKQFLDFAPGQMATIEAAVLARDREGAARHLHRLRGSAANFEATEVVDTAAAVEQAVHREDWAAVAPLVVQLREALTTLQSELEDLAARAERNEL